MGGTLKGVSEIDVSGMSSTLESISASCLGSTGKPCILSALSLR